LSKARGDVGGRNIDGINFVGIILDGETLQLPGSPFGAAFKSIHDWGGILGGEVLTLCFGLVDSRVRNEEPDFLDTAISPAQGTYKEESEAEAGEVERVS
jgi:hypothetical protein